MRYLRTLCQLYGFGFCTSDMNTVLEIKRQTIPLQIWQAVHNSSGLSFLEITLT